MNIEIVWLAWDQKMVDAALSQMTVRELYQYIVNDSFRKRVDPRSMLFHANQSYLLNEIETLIKLGAINVSIEEYLSQLFYQGEEEFPLKCGELFFDLSLISYFTSLRMADDYHMVENFFDGLFKRMRILKNSENFSFFSLGDLNRFSGYLREVKVQHILEIVESDQSLEKGSDTYIRLVQNYIEFFNYYKNNGLSPFFYNNQTDINKWGNLVERQNERSARIVNLAYKKVKRVLSRGKVKREEIEAEPKVSLLTKHKHRRRIENLIMGLRDPDPLIRQKACEYLGTFGRVEDVDHLIKALNDKESLVRQEAARALGEIRDKKAVGSLVERILKDDSVNVVTSCAQALSNIGDPKAVLALIKALAAGIYQLAVTIAFYPSLSKNKKAIKMLLKASEDSNVSLRRQIAFILGELRNRDSIRELSKRLDDEDREVKINAICSLGRIGTNEAIMPLKEIAEKSKDSEIRRYSIRALGFVSAEN